MTLKQDQIAAAAHALYHAERDQVQTAALTETYPEMTMEDAYAVQSAWVLSIRLHLP